ncbi:MAG: Nif3-like dinuclear metal center hexameric protein [Anaerovoracaceae bacterium]
MKLEEIARIIENCSPLALQESWDNSGFQIKLGNPDITRVLVSLEVTDSVISEAEEYGTELIVCHHPMIFTPIRHIDDKSVIGNYICRLIQSGVSVYATHTPFDKCDCGNNAYLASKLQLQHVEPLPGDETGICRMGLTDGDYTVIDFVRHTADRLSQDIRQYRLTGDGMDRVEKVGICTGAGAEFMEIAYEAGCDLFVTGDVKYHTAQLAREMGMNVLDIGHYGSEISFTENMTEQLRRETGLMVFEAADCRNPFTVIEPQNTDVSGSAGGI